MRVGFVGIFLGLAVAVVLAQTALTNDSIIKMAKAGLGEEIILSTVRSQPGRYATSPDDLIALKTAGVTDKVIAAMMDKMPSVDAADPPPAAAAPAVGLPSPASVTVAEVGVYCNKNGSWADVPPEVVNFKTGGVLKTIGTVGLMRGDVNGHIRGGHSASTLKTPIDLMVYTPEGVAITEYQLLRLREQKDSREFRTVTGGVLHSSGGATRDVIPFESRKIAPRTYAINLPALAPGEYGLLPPASADATSSSGRIGKIYSFHVLE
ncbi:MAG: hypothetical protein LAP87_00960 [Acidobacteriia bacterium]|nr:hypothetical protein [Terriglobia bacterium]